MDDHRMALNDHFFASSRIRTASSATALQTAWLRRMTIRCACFLLCAAPVAVAQTTDSAIVVAQPAVNTWSARSTGGMVLIGTFTVIPDAANGTVTGTWTLNGAQGAVLAHGSWSAAKSPRGWNGAWRSIVAGSAREYSGTWTASTSLRATTALPQLFVKRGIESIVNGGWRSGGNSGGWSIRIGG
jgi:hypothetical protein